MSRTGARGERSSHSRTHFSRRSTTGLENSTGKSPLKSENRIPSHIFAAVVMCVVISSERGVHLPHRDRAKTRRFSLSFSSVCTRTWKRITLSGIVVMGKVHAGMTDND